MTTDEIPIDEICVELQQLCTELEGVKKVSKPEKIRKQELDYTADKIKNAAKQARRGQNN